MHSPHRPTTNRSPLRPLCSAYGPQLATQLNLSSTQLNTIGPAGNLGVYLSGVAGIGQSVDKRGPVPTLVFAAVCLLSGYSVIKMIYDGGGAGLFATVGLPGLMVGQFLTGVGSTAGVASASNATAKSFDKSRGSALSLILAGLGLSAFFCKLSTVQHARGHAQPAEQRATRPPADSQLGRLLLRSADDTTSAFLLLLALGTAFSMVLGLFFIRTIPPTQTGQHDYIEAAEAEEPGQEPDECSPLVAKADSASDAPGEINLTGWALLKEFDFWAIFLFNGLCSGTGLLYINNLGTVTRSLAGPLSPRQVAAHQATLVSLLSVFNCAGRLVSGGLSDFFLHRAPPRWRFPRVWWQLLTSVAFLLSQVAASRATGVTGWRGLALPTMLTGFAHGSLFGMSGVLVIGRFGMKAFSFNNSMLALAPAIFGKPVPAVSCGQQCTMA